MKQRLSAFTSSLIPYPSSFIPSYPARLRQAGLTFLSQGLWVRNKDVLFILARTPLFEPNRTRRGWHKSC
jgi:hypothetical protein